MRLLLIDNSNTRTKLCLSDADQLLEASIVRLATKELSVDLVRRTCSDLEFDACVLCSVVPEKAKIIAAAIKRPIHHLTHESPLGIGIDYPEPDKIGADRLANAAATAANYGHPAIVVDFGTAVTFDVLNEENCYAGGVIAPGLAAMSDYLVSRTALLPTIDPHEPERAIGKSTEEAMHAGAIYGYRGLVSGILDQITNELETPPFILATGGDATLIARGLGQIQTIDRHLTLEGIKQIGLRFFSDRNQTRIND